MPKKHGSLASLAALALVIGCRVGALFDDPPSKVIDVTPSRVVDSAPAGSGAARRIARGPSTARGKAPPPWTAHRVTNATWLAFTADTSALDTLRLALDPKGLGRGTYRDTIVIVPDDRSIPQLQGPVELRIPS